MEPKRGCKPKSSLRCIQWKINIWCVSLYAWSANISYTLVTQRHCPRLSSGIWYIPCVTPYFTVVVIFHTSRHKEFYRRMYIQFARKLLVSHSRGFASCSHSVVLQNIVRVILFFLANAPVRCTILYEITGCEFVFEQRATIYTWYTMNR